MLTAPVTRVALPDHARQVYGHDLLPALMDSGTYAVDPEPFGPPWRTWAEVTADEARLRGLFAPVRSLSFGVPGAIAIAPGDTRGTVLIPERRDGYCCGLDGRDGPNLACERCGQPVATRVDDCGRWQAEWLTADSVRRVPTDEAPPPPEDWAALARAEGVPPIEPSGLWDPRWAAAVGTALAHLVAASAGAAVRLPDGIVASTFGHVLDRLLPPGPPVRTAALAGPGLPAPRCDIALVPRHPRTGGVWRPSGTADAVPLAADVWTYLASYRERSSVPATGGLPDGVLRDDPLLPHPREFLQPDARSFLHTLARLPAVRQPWLRGIYDRGFHFGQH